MRLPRFILSRKCVVLGVVLPSSAAANFELWLIFKCRKIPERSLQLTFSRVATKHRADCEKEQTKTYIHMEKGPKGKSINFSKVIPGIFMLQLIKNDEKIITQWAFIAAVVYFHYLYFLFCFSEFSTLFSSLQSSPVSVFLSTHPHHSQCQWRYSNRSRSRTAKLAGLVNYIHIFLMN